MDTQIFLYSFVEICLNHLELLHVLLECRIYYHLNEF